jgi:hypothetical protein
LDCERKIDLSHLQFFPQCLIFKKIGPPNWFDGSYNAHWS